MPYYYIKINDAPQWITVHPNGPGTTGTHVQIEGTTGEVLAGMGGKFNGKHISAVEKGGKNEQVGADAVIRRQKAQAAEKKAAASKPASTPTGTSKPAGKPEAKKAPEAEKATESSSSFKKEIQEEWKEAYAKISNDIHARGAHDVVSDFAKKYNDKEFASSQAFDDAVKETRIKLDEWRLTDDPAFVKGAGKRLGVDWNPDGGILSHDPGQAPNTRYILKILHAVYPNETAKELVEKSKELGRPIVESETKAAEKKAAEEKAKPIKNTSKSVSQDQLKSLIENGNLWEKGENKRTYFSYGDLEGALGLKSEKRSSKKKNYLDVDGDKIGNGDSLTIENALNKSWYDHNTGDIYVKPYVEAIPLDEFLSNMNLR